MPDTPPAHSPEIIDALLRDVPPAIFLAWLDACRLGGVLRGFQVTPKSIRKKPVQIRLKSVLSNHPEDTEKLIDAWKKEYVELLKKVHSLSDKKLRKALPNLRKEHGERSLHLALTLEQREKVLLHQERSASESAAKRESQKKQKKTSAKLSDSVETAQITKLQETIETQQETIGKLEKSLRAAQEEVTHTRKNIQEIQRQAELQEQALGHQLKGESNRAAKAEEMLQEKIRLADRNKRRAKKLQAELETSEQESKRLRRQVRQQQRIAEDLRKQLTTSVPKEERKENATKVLLPDTAKKPKIRKSKAPVATSSDPADQQFCFKIAGRAISISARQLISAVNRNDEDTVFTLTQALFDLRETNFEGYRLFLKRVREYDRYSARVLTGDMMRVLVDASNVARYEKNRSGRGLLDNLLALRDDLRSRFYFPIIMIADASLYHYIDQPQEYLRLVREGVINVTNKGEEADEYLTRIAQQTGAFVVTNDAKFHMKVAPNFEPLRIGFTVREGTVYLHEY